jgi:ubiquinone/menaquinone biosynthesis C-methylase UbiE
MHEKRFNREIERLRDPERVSRLEVSRVVSLVLDTFKGAISVLDVGTGSGLFAEAFAAKNLRVTGVDANPEMVTVSSQFVPSGTFHEGIAEKLPFPDQSVDIVFMGLVLHETDNTPEAMREAFRVSRKGLAILEWPYETQQFGPPLGDRLQPQMITSMALDAGFKEPVAIRLTNLSLYLVEH